MLLTFTREVQVSVDDVSDVASVSPLTYTAEAIILPAPVSPNHSVEEATRIRRDYRKLLVAGKDCGAEPEEDDRTVFENRSWAISGFTRLAPDGGPAILYTIFVKIAT